MRDLVELERLGDVVERAELHRADRSVRAAERGHDQDRGLGVGRLDPGKRLDAVELRHADVHDHQVGARFLDLFNDLDAGRRFDHSEALISEQLLEQRADGGVVVSDEDDFLGHCSVRFLPDKETLCASLPPGSANVVPQSVHAVKSGGLASYQTPESDRLSVMAPG